MSNVISTLLVNSNLQINRNLTDLNFTTSNLNNTIVNMTTGTKTRLSNHKNNINNNIFINNTTLSLQ